MLVGVVSNTDGRADALEAAMEAMRECGAEVFIHCGDVGGRHVLDALEGEDAAFVWGDRDRDRMGLLRYAQKLEIICYGVLGDTELDGKRVAVVHGDDKKLLKLLLKEQQHDYVLCGDEVYSEEKRVGKTRIINPGSLYGGLRRTVALLDTAKDEVRFLAV